MHINSVFTQPVHVYVPASRTNTYLGDLAVRGEEDPSEGIRKATAVSGKQTAGLVHVCSQLEHLLHCGAHVSHHAKSSVGENLVTKSEQLIAAKCH